MKIMQTKALYCWHQPIHFFVLTKDGTLTIYNL